MTISVLIDGFNLGMRTGTGVATYEKNLSYALHKAGMRINIIYGKPIRNHKNKMVREVDFFGCYSENLSYGFYKKNFSAQTMLLYGFLKSILPFYKISPLDIDTGIVNLSDMKDSLPYFDKIWNFSNLFFLAFLYFKLFRRRLPIKMKNKIDIAHWTYPIPIYLVNARNIYTIHDLVPVIFPYTTSDNKKFFIEIASHIAKKSDKIVTVSNSSKNDLCNILGIEETKVVNTYQVVNPSEDFVKYDKTAVRHTLNSYCKTRVQPKGYFIFIGAIEPKKNVARLIEAHAESGVKSPLLLVGPDGWMNQDVKKIINMADEKRVIHLGYVPSHALSKLVQGALALVFPSIYEGFGLPVLEAMLLGIPVMTSNVGSLKEIADGAALLVNPYDVSDMANGLRRLEADSELRLTFSREGLERAGHFGISHYISRLRLLYEEVLRV